jgi:2-octaprenylphenol hydroxylase
MNDFDIIIIGSGMSGLCLANLLLKQTDFSIAVVGALNPEQNKNTARVCAFNYNSLNIIRYINCDDDFFHKNCSFYNDVNIWQDSKKVLNFNALDLGMSNLGGVIANHIVELELWEKLKNNDRVKLYCPAEANSCVFKSNKYYVKLNHDKELSGKLLVGADGKNSWVRQQVGITTTNSSYKQNAIVAKLSSSKIHKKAAWQKFISTGPLAFLPLAKDNEVSIVWSAATQYATDLMQMSDSDFTQALAVESDNFLGDFSLLSKRFSYKLESQHARSYIANKAVLIGDAAHVAHPLAGQGVNAGLLDAAILSMYLSQVKDLQKAIVSYQKDTRGRNSGLIFAMGQIKNFFETSNPLISFGRSFGMDLVNKSTCLKKNLAKHALGLNDRLPSSIINDTR